MFVHVTEGIIVGKENELKFGLERQVRLSGTPSDESLCDLVRKLLEFGRHELTDPIPLTITDEYFDTAQDTLRGMGATARIRTIANPDGKTLEQTFKSPKGMSKPAEFVRDEDTVPMVFADLDTKRRTMPVEISSRFGISASDVSHEPRLVITNHREQFIASLIGEDVAYEVSLDAYTGRYGETETAKLYELEIESKSGDAEEELSELKFAVLRWIPKITVLSENKYQRALRMLDSTSRSNTEINEETLALIELLRKYVELDREELADILKDARHPSFKSRVTQWILGRFAESGKIVQKEGTVSVLKAVINYLNGDNPSVG